MTKDFVLFLLLLGFFTVIACQHGSDPVDPNDPTNPTDPNDPTDPTDPGNPVSSCDPDTVYFTNTIMPLIASSCSVPGCHDAATASDGVVLTDYQNIISTADVEPGDPENSDLYEVITDSDPDDHMPPPDSGITLSDEQINQIYTWILQGARNNSCEETNCNTTDVSFQNDVFVIINNKCSGCHSGANPQGGIALTNYNEILVKVEDGALLGAIQHEDGYTPMPFNQPQLPQCDIDKIKAWIDDGAQNN